MCGVLSQRFIITIHRMHQLYHLAVLVVALLPQVFVVEDWPQVLRHRLFRADRLVCQIAHSKCIACTGRGRLIIGAAIKYLIGSWVDLGREIACSGAVHLMVKFAEEVVHQTLLADVLAVDQLVVGVYHLHESHAVRDLPQSQ